VLSRVRERPVLGAASHHTDVRGPSRPGASKCWTSSCWPLRSASSRFPSATRSPAIDSEEAFMTFDYSLAGLVTVGLMIYLVYALLKPERL
jgi:K+-transporting ATPase KdpF subunit